MANRFWVGGTGTWDGSSTANWSATTGGASGASAPTSADTVVFDANSGTGTCTTDATAACGALSYGSATVNLTLGADLTAAISATVTAGTLSLASYKLTSVYFNANVSTARTLAFGTGNITLTGNATTIWNTTTITGLTVTGTPVVNCTYAGGTGTRAIVGTTTEATAISFNFTAGTDNVYTGSGFSYKNLDFTGFSGTLSNSARNIYGNLVISSGMTLTAGTAAQVFTATSGTQQITTNGKTLDFPITQNGVGGTVQLQDNLTMGSTRTFTLTNGALDLNNLTLSTGLFSSSNANTRAIAFGTGNIELTGNGGIIWNNATATNFAYTGTSTVNCTYLGSTGTRSIFHGTTTGFTEANTPSFYITAGSDIVDIWAAKNLDFTGFSGSMNNARGKFVYGNLTISTGMTVTAGANILSILGTSGIQQITTNGKLIDIPINFSGLGGTFAFQDALTQGSTRAFNLIRGTTQLKAGVTSTVGVFTTTGTNAKYLKSTTAGSQATLSQASGTVNALYLTIQDINATGGAIWNARTDLGSKDITNNTGWNFIYIAIQQILKPIMEKILKPIILN